MKKGDKVQIIKPGIFFGLSGVIESLNTQTTFKPLLVDLEAQGVWSFNYGDIVQPGKESSVKEAKTLKAEAIIAYAEEKVKQAQKIVDKKNKKTGNKKAKQVNVKRAYVRKDPNQPVKQKRQYNKKAK